MGWSLWAESRWASTAVPHLPEAAILRSTIVMDDGALSTALERVERALGRIERAVAARDHTANGREQALRSKVREAVAELDQLIRSAGEQNG